MNLLTTDHEIPQPVEESRPEETGDYEIVLGRRQVASVSFVAIVAMVTFSAISYLAGKAMGPAPAEAEPAPAIMVPVRVPGPPIAPPPVVQHVAAKAPAPTTPEPPLFADPETNVVYLQMGAVERGIAAVFAEGLRREGLQSFVAPGPEEKIFRVLIGPLRDPDAYRAAKDKVDAIGLSTFAKRYVK